MENLILEFIGIELNIGHTEICNKFKVYGRKNIIKTLFELLDADRVGYEQNKFYIKKNQ